ncbi:assimilatory sulfite reductase (NADPH) flavoprotein subunit [Pueribacillus theae]|uniref:assimilatory sulfite reductase (NADPH) n=1 Tax=Pueribacillus theae TaxID=2171751 RepID=A0A2U1JXN0_9BACI|nr:assimilatory sulfite reductase (NADPH) flavoprotein subunit [Pueribacillus theae]PWA09704.1 assimilatory sulfite reductase (NADPH) flavoprotein subunit [Pueribacillus theae]
MQLQVMNSPFNKEQVELLNQLLPNLSEIQRVWLSGYLSAIPGTGSEAAASIVLEDPAVASAPNALASNQEVTVLFGSQTGNCQELAESITGKMKEKGFQVTLSSMNDFKPNTLKKVKNLLIVVSTHGEGDPPDNALSFYEFLNSRRAPKLEELRYSVLSLGDSSYDFFCQTGKEFDERLKELGAESLWPRMDCDLDFDETAEEWMEGVLSALSEGSGGNAGRKEATLVFSSPAKTVYSRTNPFQAEVLENLNLNGRGSNKETRHLELSLEGSNFQFEPGDSLGIYPENDPALVDTLIDEMGWDPEELVPINKQGEERTLQEALRNHFEITVLTKPLLKQAVQLFPNEKLKDLMEPEREQALKNYLNGRDLLDFVKDFSLSTVPAREFIPMLRKMPARLYSIASSYLANPDEVHLTIGTVRYHTHGRARAGVCSIQCAERVQPGDTLPVYLHRNPNFKLPPEPDRPIIMIGPGTGIAPFRSFLEEREEIGATGKTWLFFGDQHYVTDFLYQIEWQRWLKDGVLTRMDVAFSRDTAEKIYVQHRMLEKSKDLFTWLEEGAAIYVCGDEKHMAKDVHHTLETILKTEGHMSKEEAEGYLIEMQRQNRYQRDVY